MKSLFNTIELKNLKDEKIVWFVTATWEGLANRDGSVTEKRNE